MQTMAPDGSANTFPFGEDEFDVPIGIEAAMVDTIDRARTPMHNWPNAIRELYHEEVVRRLYREQHFLFLLGLLMCLSTIAIDIIVNPAMVQEGVVLRVLAIAPLTILGLCAGARGWTQLLAFCVGASPIAFVAVIVHLAVHLPPDIAPRYLFAPALLVGLGNVILPHSFRGLVIFDLIALLVAAALLAIDGLDTLTEHIESLLVFVLVAAATLPVAARFEKLRQNNFLLTLRARIFSRELLKSNRALVTLSETDPMTGIANRRYFERKFDETIIAPGEHGRAADQIALMMIDLDYFKMFNDAHGHQAGDSCLRLVAHALVEIFDEAGGIVARYGGEEFIAAVRMQDTSAILAIAEDVRQTVASVLTPVSQSDRSLVTASIGVGIAPASAMLPREELVEMADAALYSGKDQGRNRVEVVEAEAAFSIRP